MKFLKTPKMVRQFLLKGDTTNKKYGRGSCVFSHPDENFLLLYVLFHYFWKMLEIFQKQKIQFRKIKFRYRLVDCSPIFIQHIPNLFIPSTYLEFLLTRKGK